MHYILKRHNIYHYIIKLTLVTIFTPSIMIMRWGQNVGSSDGKNEWKCNRFVSLNFLSVGVAETSVYETSMSFESHKGGILDEGLSKIRKIVSTFAIFWLGGQDSLLDLIIPFHPILPPLTPPYPQWNWLGFEPVTKGGVDGENRWLSWRWFPSVWRMISADTFVFSSIPTICHHLAYLNDNGLSSICWSWFSRRSLS